MREANQDQPFFQQFPLIVGWELTLRCNLRCAHCASSAGGARQRELTLKEALNLCDQFPDLLVQEVDFTGGEPLLCEYWMEVFARLQQLEITAKVITNGYALTQDRLTRLGDLGVAGIGVSLDGLAHTHDALRGAGGLFDHIVHAVPLVQQTGIPLTVITTATSQNISELPELLTLLIDRGVESWQIQPIFPLGRAHDNDFLQLSKADFLALGDFVVKNQEEARQLGLEIMPADSFGYYTYRDQRDPPWLGCPAGLYSCGITSDGKVKGCLSMPDDLIEGNLRERDFWSIWFDPHSFAFTRRFTRSDLGDNCRDCESAEDCLGGCSAMSYGATGAFHNNPYCFSRLEMVKAVEHFRLAEH